ncbi:MAG: DoxX family membrane protein [Firmicutes bacterium]|jgi:thiosulfate dehydrogenase [quinone] large subunit|nr:DoxX family membrane protein [Bacillota bacterium]
MREKVTDPSTFPDPPYVQTLFGSARFAWLWTLVRLYVGWAWLTAGWDKVGNPAWVQTGAAVRGFWTQAVAVPETGRAPITYDWYRSFLNFLLEGEHYVWMAKLIAWGELLIGIGLILGALTGFAAFFGALLNFNFMLAGTASTNPVLFFLSILLIMAWKVAGWYGLDRWLLPLLGTPWKAPAARARES